MELNKNPFYNKQKMAKKPLDRLKLAVGRLLGQSKRKDRDVVQLWQDMMLANNIKTSDRLLELLAWDLKEGGVQLREYKQVKHNEKMDQAFGELELAGQISKMANDFASKTIAMETERAKEVSGLLDVIKEDRAKAALKQVEVIKHDSRTGTFDEYSAKGKLPR